jgi:hypothetical protein
MFRRGYLLPKMNRSEKKIGGAPAGSQDTPEARREGATL